MDDTPTEVGRSMSTLEILEPTKEIPDFWKLVDPKQVLEPTGSGRPMDELQQITENLGRVNSSYESVWRAVKLADGLWVPVRCNSMRRALLLASAALQNRTQAHNVRRRGRIVLIQLMKEAA